MPAVFEAKFWMPPIEATWPRVGATSAGSDQMLAAAKQMAPLQSESNAMACQTSGTSTASPMHEETAMPETMGILRAQLSRMPLFTRRSDVRPPIQPKAMPTAGGIAGTKPILIILKPRASTRYVGNHVMKKYITKFRQKKPSIIPHTVRYLNRLLHGTLATGSVAD